METGGGKVSEGTIRLSAEQAGGNILIAVEDDGAGINRERVLQVARDRMVVGPDGDEAARALLLPRRKTA